MLISLVTAQIHHIYGHLNSPATALNKFYPKEKRGRQCSSITVVVELVRYLSEPVRLRGAERVVGQLQQLLRTLQGFGAGTQLTLSETQSNKVHLQTLSFTFSTLSPLCLLKELRSRQHQLRVMVWS